MTQPRNLSISFHSIRSNNGSGSSTDGSPPLSRVVTIEISLLFAPYPILFFTVDARTRRNGDRNSPFPSIPKRIPDRIKPARNVSYLTIPRSIYHVQFIRRNSTSADVCPSVRTVRIPCRLSTRIVNRDRSVEKDRREEVSIKRKREVHAHAHWKGCTRCFFLVIKDQRHDPARQAGNTCRPRQMTSVLVNIR